MLTDEQLQELTPAERADLARRLAAMVTTPMVTPAIRRRRHRFIVMMTTACVLLIPWTAGLAVTLPRHYVAGHWRSTWVGFDVVLGFCLAATSLLAWHARQAVILACFITATLLTCDAWFDVTTASTGRDTLISVLSALLVELPLAGMLVGVGLRLLRFAVARARTLSGLEGPTSLWGMPLFGVPVWDGKTGVI